MSSSAPRRQAAAEASTFAYVEADLSGGGADRSFDEGQAAEERSRQQAEAFAQGRQSAQQQFGPELEAALVKNREQVGHAIQEFARERQSYYLRVEGEVVQLALAIARKVLHREVQIDANALAGIVRITLEKLDTGTKVDVHVSPQEATDWRHYFACQSDDGPAPEVHEDPAIPAGECRIETSLGATEIGIESQLKEIETGLLDLLAERPGAAPRNPAPASGAPERGR